MNYIFRLKVRAPKSNQTLHTALPLQSYTKRTISNLSKYKELCTLPYPYRAIPRGQFQICVQIQRFVFLCHQLLTDWFAQKNVDDTVIYNSSIFVLLFDTFSVPGLVFNSLKSLLVWLTYWPTICHLVV